MVVFLRPGMSGGFHGRLHLHLMTTKTYVKNRNTHRQQGQNNLFCKIIKVSKSITLQFETTTVRMMFCVAVR